MRILQLIMARQDRGAEISTLELARDLVSARHEVLLVSLFTPETEKLNVDGVEFVDLSGIKTSSLSVRLLFNLYRTIKKFKPDIVQANAGDTLKYAALVKQFFPLRFRLVFRNASTMSQYLKTASRIKLQALLFRKVDIVASVSHLSAKDAARLFPFLKERIVVIPVGVRGEPVKVNRDTDREGLFREAPVFIHVGGFTFEKNHKGLLSIFSQYLKRGNGGTLLLVGNGPLKASVEKLANQLELTSHVKFLGTRKDVFHLFKSSTAMLLPSVIEGLPSVIVEAFYAGLPVIAYNVGGIPELVKTGETGWLMEKNDEAGFVNAMVSVTRDHEGVRRMSSNAEALVKSNYDQQLVSRRFIETYTTLLKS